jgi:porin
MRGLGTKGNMRAWPWAIPAAFLALPALSAWAQETKIAPKGFWQQDSLTGDWGGLRTTLEDHGLTIAADEIDDGLADVSGGVRTGSVYQGRLELALDLDLDKLARWGGGAIHLDGYESRGRGLTENEVGNLLIVDNIEDQRQIRMAQIWFQQSLFGDRIILQGGQLASYIDFFSSTYAAPFLNSSFVWPAITSLDLTSTTSATPIATPGVRLQVKLPLGGKLAWHTTISYGSLEAVSDSAGPATSAAPNDHEVFVSSAGIYTDDDPALPGSLSLGAWYLSGTFDDQSVDQAGQSLTLAPAGAAPRRHNGDFGLFAVADKLLWRLPDTTTSALAGFLRFGWAPDDRNLVAFYADAGLDVIGPFAGRRQDIVGIAFAVARIGAGARSLDATYAGLASPDYPIHDAEAVLELTYQLSVAPWWTLQPDLQYVIHPGANIPIAPGSTEATPDAVVIGLRSILRF